MPEVTVTEDRYTRTGEDNIGPSGQLCRVRPEAQAQFSKGATQKKLRLRVGRTVRLLGA
jgi:hypothetical protein